MLEFSTTNHQLETQAAEIIGTRALRVRLNKLEGTLEGYINALKGDSATEKLTIHAVDFRNDGTTSVEPRSMDNGNPFFLKEYLGETGKTLMISNKKGDTLCFALLEVNGVNYLQTFRPEDAQTLRDELTAQMTEPKKPSLYDKFCNWCATTFRGRPGKVVGAYNEHKAFNVAMKKALDNMASIPEKVESYKQEKVEAQRREAERIEQERLREEQLQKEREAKELEAKSQLESQRKQQEEALKRQAEELKRQMEENEKKFKAEQEREKALQREKRTHEVRAMTIKKYEETIPENEAELAAVTELRNKLKPKLKEAEANLNKLRERLATDQKYLHLAQDTYKQLKAEQDLLTDQIKQQEQLKALHGKKEEASAKMEVALKDRNDLEIQLKAAREAKEQRWKEWSAVAPSGQMFAMKPEEYLLNDYNQKRAVREKEFNEQNNKRLEQIERYRSDIKELETRINEQKSESSFFEKSFLGGRTVNGKTLSKLDEVKKQQETLLKQLETENEQKRKEFEAAEAQYKKKALNPTKEQLASLQDYLKTGKEAHLAAFDAKNAAEKKITQLETAWDQIHLTYQEAKAEHDKYLKQMDGKSYDPEVHQQILDRKKDVAEQLPKQAAQVKRLFDDAKEFSTKIARIDNDLRFDRARVADLDEKFETLSHRVHNDKSALKTLKEVHMKSPFYNPAEEQPQAQNVAQNQPQPKAKAPVVAP